MHHNSVFYLLKSNRDIVPDEIHESYPGKNIYHKDPKFSDKLSGQKVQNRSVSSLEIGVIMVYTIAISSAHCCRTAITGQ